MKGIEFEGEMHGHVTDSGLVLAVADMPRLLVDKMRIFGIVDIPETSLEDRIPKIDYKDLTSEDSKSSLTRQVEEIILGDIKPENLAAAEQIVWQAAGRHYGPASDIGIPNLQQRLLTYQNMSDIEKEAFAQGFNNNAKSADNPLELINLLFLVFYKLYRRELSKGILPVFDTKYPFLKDPIRTLQDKTVQFLNFSTMLDGVESGTHQRIPDQYSVYLEYQLKNGLEFINFVRNLLPHLYNIFIIKRRNEGQTKITSRDKDNLDGAYKAFERFRNLISHRTYDKLLDHLVREVETEYKSVIGSYKALGSPI